MLARGEALDPLNERLAEAAAVLRLELGDHNGALRSAAAYLDRRPEATAFLLPHFLDAELDYATLRLLARDAYGHHRLADWLTARGLAREAEIERNKALAADTQKAAEDAEGAEKLDHSDPP